MGKAAVPWLGEVNVMPSVLLVVDVQEGWDDPSWGARNNPEAEVNIAALVEHWHRQQWPVVAFQHASRNPESPLSPTRPGYALKSVIGIAAGDTLMTKHVNSAFVGTPLQEWLTRHGHRRIVVVGLTTAHCCSTTIRMGANLGYEMVGVRDAMATFDLTDAEGRRIPAAAVHEVELAALAGEFAEIVDTETLLRRTG
jgi:nicotinamidase-related amidase